MSTILNQSLVFVTHRLAPAMVGLLFLVAGYNKIGGFEYVVSWMSSVGLPAPALLLGLTIALEVSAGLMLIVGFKTRWAALALAAFLIPTTIVFHAFWAVDAAQYQDQLTAFLKNFAILGATILIAAQQSGSSRRTNTTLGARAA